MVALKRSRDQIITSTEDVASALLGLSNSPATNVTKTSSISTPITLTTSVAPKAKKLKTDAIYTGLSPELSAAAKRIEQEQKQMLFKLCIQTAGKVVDSIWQCAIEAGGNSNTNTNTTTTTTKGTNVNGQQGLSQAVLSQLSSIQSFYCLVVAELGKMCKVVNTSEKELEIKTLRVLSDEIKRLGAAKTAVDLLKLLVLQVDSMLAQTGLSSLVGSVFASLSNTFRKLRIGVTSKPKELKSATNNNNNNNNNNSKKEMIHQSSVVVPKPVNFQLAAVAASTPKGCNNNKNFLLQLQAAC